jgi:hypothetical protein
MRIDFSKLFYFDNPISLWILGKVSGKNGNTKKKHEF